MLDVHVMMVAELQTNHHLVIWKLRLEKPKSHQGLH